MCIRDSPADFMCLTISASSVALIPLGEAKPQEKFIPKNGNGTEIGLVSYLYN